MRRLLLSSVMLLCISGFAQNKPADFPMFFKNEKVKPSQTEDALPLFHENMRYVLVQHPKLILSNNFYGFETFEYIPKHTAFARVSKANFAAAKKQLQAAGGSVLNINPAWKLSRKMYNSNFPDWAWINDKEMKTWVRYWPGLNHQAVKAELQGQGYTILEERNSDDRIAIALNPERLSKLQDLGFVMFIQEMEDPGEPENFTARTNVRVNVLQQSFKGGLNYDGSGIMVGHNDAGMLGDHIDYKGRLTQVGNSNSSSDHGDHTAGTIFGAGNRDPFAEGMAPGADMYYATYPNNLNNADNIYTTQNVRLTSNSFSNGCNAGYTSFSRQVDQDADDNPLMLHVFSAGNNGSSDCGYGAGSGWGNVTGGHKQGKNAVTVANLTRTDQLASSSSRGPAEDGRIKPDIGAVGTAVWSTTDIPTNNSYDSKTGTSMSCPGITGSLAVLMQAYKDQNAGLEAEGVLLKGMLLNGADDLGNPGPDFKFGYGRANVRKSYQMLENMQYFSDSLSTNDSVSFSINVPSNTSKLKVMLIWPDPAAFAGASRALINDLDMTMDDGGTVYQPWVLNPTANSTALNSNAVRARDSLNNMEQITLDNPTAGSKSITVKGFNVPSGPQEFYVLYYFEKDDITITYPQRGDAVAGAELQYIRWDAPSTANSNFEVDYSIDGGANWQAIAFSLGAHRRYATWFAPTSSSNQAYIRVRNGSDTALAGPFTLTGVPNNLTVSQACPDSVTLTWDTLSNVSGYVVYQLGTKYMDSVTYVNNNTATIAHNAISGDWYAVSAVVNDTSVGFRSEAIFKSPGIMNCVLANDISVRNVLSPGYGEIPNCGNATQYPVTLEIKNNGTDTVHSFDVAYRRSGTAANIESVTQTIAPGQSYVYTFQNSKITLFNNVNLQYEYWVNPNSPDGNPFNDTVVANMKLYTPTSPIDSLPYFQDFETFTLCPDAADCGATICNLNDGWVNATNNSADAIDWRTHQGSTFSNNTGPSRDYAPGNANGKYLYTEASGGCDSAEALMQTPCIDLSGTYLPEASIYYHMYGSAMGTLTADVFDGQQWHLEVGGKLSGSQSIQWREMKIDLQQFAGKTVTIRFRGKTGSDFASDMALDGFSVYDRSGVGIDEAGLNSFKVYPNPSEGVVNITAVDDSDKATIRITNTVGAVVYTGKFSNNAGNNTMSLDLSNRANGVYFIELHTNSGKQIIRFVKQ